MSLDLANMAIALKIVSHDASPEIEPKISAD
jgi:hypothetical protein